MRGAWGTAHCALPLSPSLRQRPGRTGLRLPASPRASVASRPNAARKRDHYDEVAQEFALAHEEMSGLGIGTEYRGLPPFPAWSRYDKKRQFHEVDNNRAHNRSRIAEAKAAAPRRPPRPRLAALKPGPRCATARTPAHHLRYSRLVASRRALGPWRGSPVGGVSRARRRARSWPPSCKCCPRFRRRTSSPRFGAPPDPTKPREVFRTEFNRKASSCARVCVGGCSSRVAHRRRARVGRRVCRTSAPPRLPV